jgi:hypothetical protein
VDDAEWYDEDHAYGEDDWQEDGDEGDEWSDQQHDSTTLDAAAAGNANGAGPAAWSLPADSTAQQRLFSGGLPPALRSLCMQWFASGACAKGDRCSLVHGELCEVCSGAE